MGSKVVVPETDGGDLAERRNGSNDEHVGVTSLQNRKQGACETVRAASAVPTFPATPASAYTSSIY